MRSTLTAVANRPLCTTAGASSSSSPPAAAALSNPLLGIGPDRQRAASPPPVAVGPQGKGENAQRFEHKVKRLPVSFKKLQVVANLTRRLYWREAMLQLEFCRKTIGIHVKNAISDAAKRAEELGGLDPRRLVVDECYVGKGTYYKELDYKAKGRVGTLNRYQTHLTVVLKEATKEEVQRTKYYSRWKRAEAMLQVPWAERVAALPRYKPIPGYDPGEAPRVRDPLALVNDGETLEVQAKQGKKKRWAKRAKSSDRVHPWDR